MLFQDERIFVGRLQWLAGLFNRQFMPPAISKIEKVIKFVALLELQFIHARLGSITHVALAERGQPPQ